MLPDVSREGAQNDRRDRLALVSSRTLGRLPEVVWNADRARGRGRDVGHAREARRGCRYTRSGLMQTPRLVTVGVQRVNDLYDAFDADLLL